jgi:hypothetical protein
MGDYSRKRSIIITPSSPILPDNAFEFDRLIELHYQGKTIAGKKIDQGIVKYEGRFLYEGEFVKGVREGNGSLRLNNQEIYFGEWHNDLFHGQGTLRSFPVGHKYRNWKVYSGNFVRGRI